MSDIKRYRGDTRRLGVKVKRDGLAYDITSCTFKLTVNEVENPTTSDTPKFTSNGVITSAANGELYFPISAQNADLVGDFYFDIEMTDANTEKSTIRKGSITFEQDITK
jgi:hypothetical protein